MSEFLTTDFLTALIAGGILAGVPLMFAALGEMVSERAGVLNIGLEGMMLVGAYVGFVAAYHSGSTTLGFLAGAGGGAAVSVIMVVLCVWWGLDQIVIGIAITLVGEGATALIFDSQFAESRPTLGDTGRTSIPLLSDIPVVGGHDSSDGSVFSQPAIVYIGLILIVVVAWMMRRTRLGLNVRAAGDRPAALDAAWAWQAFPELAISTSPFEERRWYLQGTHLERLPAARPALPHRRARKTGRCGAGLLRGRARRQGGRGHLFKRLPRIGR